MVHHDWCCTEHMPRGLSLVFAHTNTHVGGSSAEQQPFVCVNVKLLGIIALCVLTASSHCLAYNMTR